MKIKFIYILLLSAFALISLQSNKDGLASQGHGDTTGGPLSLAMNCGSCHGGGFNNTALTIQVKNAGGTVVNTYIPGDSYTIEFAVTSVASFTYGFQGVVLKGANLQAGVLGTPISSNTQIVTFNGRQYAEHSSPAIGGGGFTFIVPWQAPAIGSGAVTVYADAVTVNGDNTVNGDDPAGPISLVLTETATAAINYANAIYCNTGNNPTPTISGIQGGTFSATPLGLSLNSSTGTIDVSASTVNQTYTISYTFLGGVTTDIVTINPLDDASFTYAQASYCNTSSNPTPTITGLPGGTFLSIPSGLSINPSTGEINISASAIGSYTVGYQTSGYCSTLGTFSVEITGISDASFAYNSSSYCQNGINPTPTAATPGGIYTSTSGLSIVDSTGMIKLSTSTPGTYTVTYTTAGSCSHSSTQQVKIDLIDDASFAYADTAYCQNTINSTPTITGLPNGFFTASPSGLSINTWTGLIGVSSSSIGAYTVTYTTSGTCSNSSTKAFRILPMEDASFAYDSTDFCQAGANQSPTFSAAGTWSSSPSGLSIDAATGEITVGTSNIGSYTITHNTTGKCANTSSQTITIREVDDASFSYGATTFCQNENNKSPTFLVAGTWSSSPLGLAIDTITGLVTVGASDLGSYTITHHTAGLCPNTSSQVITIVAADDASFYYNKDSSCQNGSNLIATITGLNNGVFSSSLGLSINSVSGLIDVSSSDAGTYNVRYAVTAACPSFSDTSIIIIENDKASFAYTDTTICLNAGLNPIISILETTTGSYSVDSLALVFVDSLTGEIDLAASSLGTYVITYTTNGTCPKTASVNVDLTICSGLKAVVSTDSYKLYPNPNNGVFTIENNGSAGKARIQIKDVLGRVVYNETHFMGLNTRQLLTIPAITKGIYWVEIQKNESSETLKIIVSE